MHRIDGRYGFPTACSGERRPAVGEQVWRATVTAAGLGIIHRYINPSKQILAAGGLMLWDHGDTQPTPITAPHVAPGPTVGDTLESAMLAAHRRSPGQPRLAMCVSALMQSTP